MNYSHEDLLAGKAVLINRFFFPQGRLTLPVVEASATVAKAAKSVPTGSSVQGTDLVLGFALGEKVSDTGPTGVESIRVFVKKKRPKFELTKVQILPTHIDGMPVDVVETGLFKVRAADFNPQKKHRPAPAGCSIGFDAEGSKVMAGTFGAVVRDAVGNTYILSNNHVIANEDDLDIGSPIFQPGLLDGGKLRKDRIAALTRAIAMRDDRYNLVDAAIARVDDAHDVTAAIPVIGTPRGKAVVQRNIIVHKFGRTTGYTSGYVTDTDATVRVKYGRSWLTFDGQIVIRGLERQKFSDSGDSGSLIVEKTSGKAVGLLFAGGTGYTLANPIQEVLRLLKVSLVTAEF